MESLKTAIRRNLKDAERVAVLAIGSPLRGDDAAGLQVAGQLRRIRTQARDGVGRAILPDHSAIGRPAARDGAGRAILPDRGLIARATHSALRIFLGETAPENLTGEIRKFRPTHLVILDAADSGGKRPGRITLIQHARLRGSSSISTHNMPVNILIQYLRQSVPCKVLILGIQPKSREYGRPLSAPVKKAVQRAAAALAASLGA